MLQTRSGKRTGHAAVRIAVEMVKEKLISQEEAIGRAVSHTYNKSGYYIATVTVSDLYGLKPPAKMTFKVHVTP